MAEDDYPVVVTRVTVQLANGREEVWGVPLRPAQSGPYYSWWVYLPEGARILSRTVEVLPLSVGQEIRVDYVEVPSNYRGSSRLMDPADSQ